MGGRKCSPNPPASQAKVMPRDGSNEAERKWNLSEERRQRARSEDSETEAVIRKYMKLAERALKHRVLEDVEGSHTSRYFERAQKWWQKKKKAS
jgi:hypothetical protein